VNQGNVFQLRHPTGKESMHERVQRRGERREKEQEILLEESFELFVVRI
jgi:hypothetical protein